MIFSWLGIANCVLYSFQYHIPLLRGCQKDVHVYPVLEWLSCSATLLTASRPLVHRQLGDGEVIQIEPGEKPSLAWRPLHDIQHLRETILA